MEDKASLAPKDLCGLEQNSHGNKTEPQKDGFIVELEYSLYSNSTMSNHQ
jgi:hypothetical protein